MKANLETFAKYAGIATICFEWLAVVLFYLIRPADFSGHNPIGYFASVPETKFIFSICLTVAAISFWIFTRYHLSKYYIVPVRLFTISMLAYGALALVPFDPSDVLSDTLHRILALFFFVTFIGGIFLMGIRNKNPRIAPVSYIAATLSLAATLLFLATPKGSQLLLVFEVLSAFAGQMWVVWISFHSFKADTKVL